MAYEPVDVNPRPDATAGLDRGPDDGLAGTISSNMGNLYRLRFGRMPDRVHTSFVDDDVALVVLEGSMTPAEQRLAEAGRHQELREARLATQQASADQFRNIVAAATGRRIRAFTSAHDVEADVATEVFLLADE